jgi:hypothetical protein
VYVIFQKTNIAQMAKIRPILSPLLCLHNARAIWYKVQRVSFTARHFNLWKKTAKLCIVSYAPGLPDYSWHKIPKQEKYTKKHT